MSKELKQFNFFFVPQLYLVIINFLNDDFFDANSLLIVGVKCPKQLKDFRKQLELV